MVYQVGDMLLQKTQEIFQGKVNDVIVCRDIADRGTVYYTVWVVRDRELARKLMKLFHEKADRKRNKFVADYTWKDSYLLVFDYVRERPLQRFFASEITNLRECEQMGLNLTVECLAGGIPYPILFLQLKQGQIHISKDRGIYLGYEIDLEEFSEKIVEKDCATLCAKIVFQYIEEMKTAKATSYKLLEKKLWKGGYHRFTDFYKDLKMASQPLKKEGLIVRFQKFYRHNQDRIFRFVMVVCVLLGILTLTMIISQLFFADVPLFRLFINPFKEIGTESLLQ